MSTWTLEEQKAHRKLWVEALRSGKYGQTPSVLHSVDGGYCCLGVACIVAGKTPREIRDHSTLEDFNDVKEFYGLADDEGAYLEDYFLSRDNDDGKSFREIAKIIEAEPEGLFIEATP